MKNTAFPFLTFLLILSSCGQRGKENVEQLRSSTWPAYTKFETIRAGIANAHAEALLWVSIPGTSAEKAELKKYVDGFPADIADLKTAAQGLTAITGEVDALVKDATKLNEIYKGLMNDLGSVVAYNDPSLFLPVQSSFFDSDGEAHLAFKKVADDLVAVEQEMKNSMDAAIDKIDH